MTEQPKLSKVRILYKSRFVVLIRNRNFSTHFFFFFEFFLKIFTTEPPEMSKEDAARLKQIQMVRTTPRDERFSSTNQALNCWNRYNEWVLCEQQSDADACKKLRQYAESICPSEWTNGWDEQREGLQDGSRAWACSQPLPFPSCALAASSTSPPPRSSTCKQRSAAQPARAGPA